MGIKRHKPEEIVTKLRQIRCRGVAVLGGKEYCSDRVGCFI